MAEHCAGLALVISAPSGAGKSTLIRRLRADFPSFGFSISCTTRAPREGEVDGRDYHFLDRRTFEDRRDAGYFAEWAEVHGNCYGTPLEPVRQALAEGRDLIFDIDVQGARQLRASLPEATLVFVLPPSRAELLRRLTLRGTDSAETIARRMANARQEIAAAPEFDYLVINADLERAYKRLRDICRVQKLTPARNALLVPELLAQWQG